jgi:UPF0755 protein
MTKNTKRPTKSKKRAGPKVKPYSFKRIIISFAILVFISLCISFSYFYSRVFSPNLIIEGKSSEYIYIKSSDSFEDVLNQLSNRGMLKNRESFIWLSSFMDYQKKVKPGRYKVKDGMTNRELVTLLRSGKQEPIRITFQNIRTKQALAGKVGRNLEADSSSMMEILNDNKILERYGLDSSKALSLFLPDTYEFYWNTTAPEFIDRFGEHLITIMGKRKIDNFCYYFNSTNSLIR